MPRILCIILLTFFLTPLAHGQLIGTQWGVQAGASSATIRGADVNYDARQSLLAGTYFRVNIPGPISVQGEALLLRKGATFDQVLPGQTRIRADYAATTLELPLLARARLAPVGLIVPYIFAGPYAALTLTSSIEESGLDPARDVSFRRTDAGIVLGAGAQLNLIATTVHVDVRYSLGAPGALRIDGASEGRHSVIYFVAGISLPGL